MPKALSALAALTALIAMAPTAVQAAPPLFGTTELRAGSLGALPQWQRTLRQIEAERTTYQACSQSAQSCPSRSVMAWQALIKSQAGRPQIEQLKAINRFLNDWQYKADAQNYGRRDYWATPLEFLRHSGDCEDYAITKYVTLRQLGFTPEQLRVVVLQDTARDLAHAVLAVYLDDQVYILDNLTRAVLPQERLTNYMPYYSINETTRWAHLPAADTITAAAPGRPSPGGGRR